MSTGGSLSYDTFNHTDGPTIRYDLGGADLWAVATDDVPAASLIGPRIQIFKNCRYGQPGEATCPLTSDIWLGDGHAENQVNVVVNPCTHDGIIAYRNDLPNVEVYGYRPNGTQAWHVEFTGEPFENNSGCDHGQITACKGTDGVWCTDAPPPSTTISSASNGAPLPQSTINVASTAGFASTGSSCPTGACGLLVTTSNGTQVVKYTGTTGTSFTGCSGGTGTMSTGGSVATNACMSFVERPALAVAAVSGKCYLAVGYARAGNASDGHNYFGDEVSVWDATSGIPTHVWTTSGKDGSGAWNHYAVQLAASGSTLAEYYFSDISGACNNGLGVHGDTNDGITGLSSWGQIQGGYPSMHRGGSRGWAERLNSIGRSAGVGNANGAELEADWTAPLCMPSGSCEACAVSGCASGQWTYVVQGSLVQP